MRPSGKECVSNEENEVGLVLLYFVIHFHGGNPSFSSLLGHSKICLSSFLRHHWSLVLRGHSASTMDRTLV